ncbi:hypothetical protein FCM35_KLT06555 [Carex littledalei]|uniref:Uncharacterized protein n=1 Tax=Carex littledalei TaxID=544730 RepID=A0A833R0Z8_9POAL|nr:hypothetical protein FCM35_KLT06555 [Carex littledalei]
MPPQPTSTETLSKTKATLLFLAMAMSLLLVHILVKRSSTISLLITANIIILFLFFHYRRNPDQIPHPPLFSFPSLSRQLWYKPLGEYNVDLPESVVSLSPGVPRNLEPDMLYDRSTDGLAWERAELSERILTEYREEEISSLADDRVNDDQGSTMDETWNSIVARGKTKPVRLIPKSQREGNPKSQMKKSSSEKRSEKKKATGSTSYDSAERSRAEGSRTNGTGISRDELSHLSDMFIKKRYNDLKIERQESDQRRLAKRLQFRDFRNAVSAN